jgi:ABC-type phosphate/phosphonate transport system ATPase subunit
MTTGDVSRTLQPVILRPSSKRGASKSTLLKSLLGLITNQINIVILTAVETTRLGEARFRKVASKRGLSSADKAISENRTQHKSHSKGQQGEVLVDFSPKAFT